MVLSVPVLKLLRGITELNNLRIIICLRKAEVAVERILVFNITEHCWSMAYTVCHAPIPVKS